MYLYSYHKYEDNIFNTISQSEQQHMDKALVLLNTYNIKDPALPNREEFANRTLQNLYDELTQQVDISLLEALKVGATIEEFDIDDIEDFEERTTITDLLNIYDLLKCGSRNRLRSYYNQLVANGTTYTPQYISISVLEEIVGSQNEKCGK